MAKLRTPRGAWVDAAMRALVAVGPDAVRAQAQMKETLDTWEKTGTVAKRLHRAIDRLLDERWD